ncbi:hypothetical protein LAZ67_4003109 [Cordylochernes scorpioides]|uniref:Reverse transcriptase domain-containing protein n=1 Tax=Cordylochernes scorpioides TaxID=51811 RepID=A0ABY6KDD5_9ARAC|nr:hypothetical protein LAZ67_4003109 [Cordylochernes scorpioides]
MLAQRGSWEGVINEETGRSEQDSLVTSAVQEEGASCLRECSRVDDPGKGFQRSLPDMDGSRLLVRKILLVADIGVSHISEFPVHGYRSGSGLTTPYYRAVLYLCCFSCPPRREGLPDGEDGIFTTVGGSKKRPHDPDHANSGTKKGCVQAPRIPPNSSRPRATPRPSRVHECQTTRQKQATFRARSAAGQADQCVYLEFCPDFTQEQYFRALEAKLGKSTVYQLTKMERQILVGLSNVQQADKLVEDGLEIDDAILRATPLKKRAERIVFGNVPFLIENGDLVAALRPYGLITSIVQKMLELGDAYWADARCEAFITLRDGVKLCHKRSNCPRKTGVQEASLLLPGDSPPGPKNAGRRQSPSSNTMPDLSPTRAAGPPSTAAPTPAASSAPPVAPPPAAQTQTTAAVDPSPPPPRLSSGVKKSKTSSRNMTNMALENPKASTSPHEMKKEETQVSSPSETSLKTRKQLNDLLEQVLNDILDQPELEGLERSEILEALATIPGLKKLQKKIGDKQKTALTRVAEMLVEALPNSHSAIYRSLMARVLWPGNISIVSIDVRGQEVRVINCHLTHIPRERLEQLESIKAAAIQEDAWVVGDLNIDDQSTSDTASGSVEALTELMEQTALLAWTELSCHRAPGESDTIQNHYRLSDHRAVLVQLGPPPFPRQPCVAAMLRSVLVDEYLLATIERTAESIADISSEALWIRWAKIKAELLAEVRSLHVSSVADDGHISRAGRFRQARLEAASSAADYPSLPDRVAGSCNDAYSIYQRRFARESSDPIAASVFIRGTTTLLTLEENHPLIRPVITGAEIAAAIRRLPLGRAPGWDDLPCEFLIAYEDFFVEALRRVFEALRRVFEASKLRGALPSSIRRSTICLVPKSNGGPGLPTADYRVLGNILLQRLRPHLPFLLERGENSDEIHMATRNGSELAVISTDLESAFDTLDRSFLVSLMVTLRLPPAFIEWFLLLYAGADAAVRAGGLHTRPFHLLNGSASPGNVLAYADDIVLLIRRDELFDVVINIFEDFRRASGIDVNFAESRGLWCGAWRARTDAQLGISWTSEKLRVLGCNVILRLGTISPRTARGAANSLVLSAVVHHLHGYLPTDSTIAKLQARLVRFVWGPQRNAWLPGGVLARPVSVGGLGLLDIGTQLRLACFKGVQAALRGSLNAYSWLALWEAVSEILDLNHRVLPPHHGGRGCALMTSPAFHPSLCAPRATLADVAALTTFCNRLVEQNRNYTHRVENIENAIVLRGTATPLQRLTTRTARRMLEPHPASARESCIACGSGDLLLAHRYWSCRRIRPVIVEAFTIIQQPPDPQAWIFGHGLEDDALAILASAKARLYRHFLTLELRGAESQENGLQAHVNLAKIGQVSAEISAKDSEMAESHSDSNNYKDANSEPAADGGHANSRRNWADCPELDDHLIERQDVSFTKVEHRRKRPGDSEAAGRKAKRGCVQAAAAKQVLQNVQCLSQRYKNVRRLGKNKRRSEPDFSQAQYFLALEAKLGNGSVYQLTKMEGHILVGLSSVQLAVKLIEEGLDIEDATLRAFPLRKRAERIVLGNVFFFVEDLDLVAALRPYGQVTSIVQKMMKMGDSAGLMPVGTLSSL